MFTTEHFRRPSLHETIFRLCLREDQTRTVLTLRSCLKNQGKCQLLETKKNKPRMLIFFGRLGIEEPEHLRMR